MTARLEAIALVRADLGVEQIVRQLADQDPTSTLVALEAALGQLGDRELRSQRAKIEGLGAILNGLGVDGADHLDVELGVRHETLARARAQLWRVWLETSRAIGRRLAATPAEPGRPRAGQEAPRRVVGDAFGLNAYRARELVDLAELEADAYDDARRLGLAALGAGKVPTLAKLLRVAASGGLSGDEWSTPPEIVAAIRAALGGQIGVDVASHLAAQAAVVRALRWYGLEAPRPKLDARQVAWGQTHAVTSEQWETARESFGGVDALAEGREWYLPECPTLHGNPPYSREAIERFFDRLRGERERHPDLAWCWLVNLDPAKDDQRELGELGLQCLPNRRIAFLGADGQPVRGTMHTQVIFGGGGIDRDMFRRSMADVGPVYQSADPAVSFAEVARRGRSGQLTEAQVDELLAAVGVD